MSLIQSINIKKNLDTSNPQQCHECLLKQKYVSSVGGINLKCIKHQFQEKQKQLTNIQLSITAFDQIIQNLTIVIQLMPQFSEQIDQIAKQDRQNQIQQVLDELEKIKNYLTQVKSRKGSRSNETSIINFSISENSIYKNSALKNENKCDTSDKTQALNIQIDQQAINKSIKEWVMHFTDQLTLSGSKKSLSANDLILPFQENIEMSMFRQKIQIKYEQFSKKLEDKDKMFNQAINKLAHYVQKVQKMSPKQSKYSEKDSNSFNNKYLSPMTPLRAVQITKSNTSRSNSQISNTKINLKQSNSIKANTSTFVLDNVSGIFPNQFPNQCYQDTYFLLMTQALTIQSLIHCKVGQNKSQNLIQLTS